MEARVSEYITNFSIYAKIDLILKDIYLKFTRNLIVDGCCFEFDAVFDVYVGYSCKYRDEQTRSRWFTVHCAAEVDNVLISFEVASIALYEKTSKRGNTMQDFVPVISKIQMDEEARKFLLENYPQALNKPMKVPISDIARDLGLELNCGYMLSEDFNYFGQISFSDTKTKVFDIESGKAHDVDVTRGTILIDPGVFWERSSGCGNFTIAHEIVHWEKHRLFADIKRLMYNDSYVAHRCPKPKNIFIESDKAWNSEEWMEWQANGIGARILMPKETLPAKIDEITAGFSEEVKANKTEYYIMLINELANFYDTSLQTAKYRLIDLGHDEVASIQINDYDYQAYTHEIDEYKAYYELCDNKELRILVESGFFIYADNHFVINHDKCIAYDNECVPHLTDFAFVNLNKCTLKFTNIRINMKESGKKFSDILYRSKTYETFQKYNAKDNNAAFEFARELAADFTAQAPEREKVRVSFCNRMQQIMKLKNIDSSAFQALTLLSRDTFSKLKKQNYKPSFETIIAICAGLDLDIAVTNELLNKAGYSFDGSEKHNAYMAVITLFVGKSILIRNEFLRNLNINGVKPLGEKDLE